jgi:excisionase family DNA binding protein
LPSGDGQNVTLPFVGNHMSDAMLNDVHELPLLLTAAEAAVLLRTTRKAIYVMAGRKQLPGVTHVGRRVLIRRDDLLHWLDQNCRAPSLKE